MNISFKKIISSHLILTIFLFCSLSEAHTSVTLTATDPAGLTGSDSIEVQVADPSDVTPPAASLDDNDCVDVT